MKFNLLCISPDERKLVVSRDGDNDDALLFLGTSGRRTGSTSIRTDQEMDRVIPSGAEIRLECLTVDFSDPNGELDAFNVSRPRPSWIFIVT